MDRLVYKLANVDISWAQPEMKDTSIADWTYQKLTHEKHTFFDILFCWFSNNFFLFSSSSLAFLISSNRFFCSSSSCSDSDEDDDEEEETDFSSSSSAGGDVCLQLVDDAWLREEAIKSEP
jgi:hypothetical protein